MIRCAARGLQTEKEMDLFADPIPTCPRCGSVELEYKRCRERGS